MYPFNNFKQLLNTAFSFLNSSSVINLHQRRKLSVLKSHSANRAPDGKIGYSPDNGIAQILRQCSLPLIVMNKVSDLLIYIPSFGKLLVNFAIDFLSSRADFQTSKSLNKVIHPTH